MYIEMERDVREVILSSGRRLNVTLTREELHVAFPRYTALMAVLNDVTRMEYIPDKFDIYDSLEVIMDRIESASTVDEATNALMALTFEVFEVTMLMGGQSIADASREDYEEFANMMRPQYMEAATRWLQAEKKNRR